VILTGGGGKNSANIAFFENYLQNRGLGLENFGEHNFCAVALGGASLYHDNPPTALPDRISFYFCRSMLWSPSKHQDTFRWKQRVTTDELGNISKQWQRDFHKPLIQDAWAETTWHAPNRLLHAYTIEPDKPHRSHLVPIVFNVAAKYRKWACLSVSVYSSEKSNLAHKPLYFRNGQQREMTEYPISFTDLPDLHTLGYKAQKSTDGTMRYEIKAGIHVVVKQNEMLLETLLFPEDQEFVYENGKRSISKSEAEQC
jgi:hypothetical protein